MNDDIMARGETVYVKNTVFYFKASVGSYREYSGYLYADEACTEKVTTPEFRSAFFSGFVYFREVQYTGSTFLGVSPDFYRAVRYYDLPDIMEATVTVAVDYGKYADFQCDQLYGQ